jgi:YbbR domain-containing protein
MVAILRWFRDNAGSLLLSLLVGLTIWVIVNQEQNPVREDDFRPDVKIAITGLKNGLIITNEYATSTRLRVRAQQDTWSHLTADQFTVTANLNGLGPGTYDVPINVEIAQHTHASVIGETPSVIRLVIEEIKTRELPIQTHLDGQLAVGWSAGKASVTPARVEATGPRSAVDLISEVRASVSVQNVRQTITQNLPLVALDPSGNPITNVTLKPDHADVTLPLTQEAGYKDVQIRPQPFGQPDPAYYIAGVQVVPDHITVRGDPQIIEAMPSVVETEPVTLDGLTADLVQEVTLDLPPGVTPVDNTKIQVLVTVKALQSSRRLTPQVQVVGLGKGLTATLSPKTVDLILSGPVAILNELNTDVDVIVTVDLTGLTVGTYNKEPEVQISRSEVVKASIFPTVVSVTIKVSP